MVSMRPDAPLDEVLRELTEQAKALWGEERAKAISSSVEATARRLWEVSRNLPQRDLEPGFYQ
ncbi:MAG: hypothetical protein QGH97_00900 [Dehalococcoidia bacterium]|jgi:hypothetical protein|nr:hypothetical protein [Dehalococcoidia bacterium]MDP7510388.1 hypothetical protein [Dehalococcoidia bacterium]